MSLLAYLSGSYPDARPNPRPPWRLWHRHAEGGEWRQVGRALREDVLRDVVLAPPFPVAHGDLLRLWSPGNLRRGFWVFGRRGFVEAGPVDEGLLSVFGDWVEAWEEEGADGDALLRAAARVHPARRACAACDCVAAVEHLLPAEAQEVLTVARRWARDEAGDADLAWARERALRLARGAVVPEADEAADRTTAHALAALAAATDPARADRAASSAAAALGEERARGVEPGWRRDSHRNNASMSALAHFAPVVRRSIPLPVVLLARAGEPTPWSLGF